MLRDARFFYNTDILFTLPSIQFVSSVGTWEQLLGVNIFTYILGAAIAFFLGMNALLGPGWLGSTIGIPGTGTFTEQSDLIPDTFDLSKSEYLF